MDASSRRQAPVAKPGARLWLLLGLFLVALLLAAPGSRAHAQDDTPEPPPTATPDPRRPVIFVRSSHTEPAAVTPGGVVDLFVELHNVGVGAAANILVGFSGEGFVPEGSSSIKNVPGLGPDQHANLSQRLRATSDLSGGPHAVTLTITYLDNSGLSYSSTEVVGVNVVGSTPTPAPRPAGKPQLVIEQVSTEPSAPTIGQPFTLTLMIHNAGAGAARNVILNNDTPSPFAAVGAGSALAVGGIGWQETVQTAVSLVADQTAKVGVNNHPITLSYTNAAGEASESKQNVAITISASTTVQSAPEALVVVDAYAAEVAPITPGRPFTLAVDLRNVGGAAARQVTVEFSSETITPLGSGNVRFLAGLDAGAAGQVQGQFILDGGAKAGVHLMKLKIGHADSKDAKGEPVVREEQISLLVVSPPQLRFSFYRDPGPALVGQTLDLPVEVFNVGKTVVSSTRAEFMSDDLEIISPPGFIGALDAGVSVTVDGQAQPRQAGPAIVRVRVHYLDDFNQEKFVDGEMEVQVEEAPPPLEPGVVPANQPGNAPASPARPAWLRALRGFLGLGSAG